MPSLDWIKENQYVALWVGFALIAVFFWLGKFVIEPIYRRPAAPADDWSGTETLRRSRLSCASYLVIGLTLVVAVWKLWRVEQEVTVLLSLLIPALVAAYLLFEVWTGCRGPILQINESGIDCRGFGFISWDEVDGVRLALPPPFIRLKSAALYLYVSDIQKFQKRLSFIKRFNTHRGFPQMVGRDVIALNLDELNRSPDYIFAAAERLHRRALEKLRKVPKARSGVKQIDELHDQLNILNVQLRSIRDGSQRRIVEAKIAEITERLRQGSEAEQNRRKTASAWLVFLAALMYALLLLVTK